VSSLCLTSVYQPNLRFLSPQNSEGKKTIRTNVGSKKASSIAVDIGDVAEESNIFDGIMFCECRPFPFQLLQLTVFVPFQLSTL
jgi:hypothetical protein